jgi:hypothetical protein
MCVAVFERILLRASSGSTLNLEVVCFFVIFSNILKIAKMQPFFNTFSPAPFSKLWHVKEPLDSHGSRYRKPN